MAIRLIEAGQVPPQLWKNGGGSTRELLAWPSPHDWSVRISMADIGSDGPFSPFPGVERWFAVVTGGGVILGLDGIEAPVRFGDEPLRFDGGAAPSCRLIGGPTRDLNFMLKGMAGGMLKVTEAEWPSAAPFRALFTAVPGRWSNGRESRELPGHTLLWDDSAAGEAWHFHAQEPGLVPGWWLISKP